MAIDFTVPAGQVRLLISDVDEENLIFEDDMVAGFLTLAAGDVLLAAAQALDTIASSETLVSKKQKTLDVETDGPAVAVSLRAHAARLREQAINGFDGGGDFDIAEMVVDPHTFGDRFLHELERQSAAGWPFDPEFL